MSEKVRVYEVAKQLGVENKALIAKIKELDIEVKNHMSVLTPADVSAVRKALSSDKPEAAVETKHIAGTVVRRRRRRAPSAGDKPKEEKEAKTAKAEVEEKPKPVAENKPAAEPAVAEPSQEDAKEAEVVPEPTKKAKDEPSVEEPKEEAVQSDAHVSPVEKQPSDTPSEAPDDKNDDKRFGHAPLPPGVVGRGETRGTGAAPLSEERRRRIVKEHQANKPRRRVRGPGSIAPRRPFGGRPSKRRMAPGKKAKQTEITVASAHKRIINIENEIALQALAQEMAVKSSEVLGKLMKLGVGGININSTLDADTAMLLAEEFGYEVENVSKTDEEVVEDARGDFVDKEEDRIERAPIITIMGHVDHGKTSLLDKIRSTNVAEGEAGGITQHISSFKVKTKKGEIVFLDTPGHEAFTEMRARGAQATDIVILVVAADDGVKPQTREAVSHSQAAKVPIVVAVNKIDKPDATPEKVMNELAALGLQPEEWGGDVPFVSTSAHTGQGLDELLENILLQAEMLELQANPKIPAEGVILESYLDKGRGPVANLLVRNGSLKRGDHVVAGAAWGRVRAMTDDRGTQLKAAGPATPIELLGMQELPPAGELLYQVVDARKAQEVADTNKQEQAAPAMSAVERGLQSLQEMMKAGQVEELNLVVKADVQGSLEALKKSFSDIDAENVKVKIIHTGVGGITESDIMLASASEAIVIGFNVRPQGKARATAKSEKVELRLYSVIYEAIDDVKAAMAGLLAPKLIENELGKAEVRDTFKISSIGTIAGCMVTEGKILRSSKARLVRDGVVVWEGDLSSLQRFKDSVKEVPNGMECGIGLANFNDVKPGDVIESFDMREVAAELE